jgi:ATP-dependent Lon protease
LSLIDHDQWQIEWLTSLPWPTSSSATSTANSRDRAFLTSARAQLDADHFGLEKIKKRLIEYLAVMRLKEINASKKETLTPAMVESSSEGEPKAANASRNVHVPSAGRKAIKGPILLCDIFYNFVA